MLMIYRAGLIRFEIVAGTSISAVGFNNNNIPMTKLHRAKTVLEVNFSLK